MNSKVVGLTLLILFAMNLAYAQNVEEQTYKAFNPIIGLTKALVRVGWDLTKLFLGMDEAQIAYFSEQLGIRDVWLAVNGSSGSCSGGTIVNCSLGTIKFENEKLTCANLQDRKLYNITDDGKCITQSDIKKYYESIDQPIEEKPTKDQVLTYLTRNDLASVVVSDSAKGQVMLFAIAIPLAILLYILIDFFLSTGILRKTTATIISVGIALIAMRSGAYTGLLMLIGQLFGPGGFFLSMLSIYLLIAILLWFYGGVLKAKRIAEASQVVSDAIVDAFVADIRRGLAQHEAAESLAKKKQ